MTEDEGRVAVLDTKEALHVLQPNPGTVGAPAKVLVFLGGTS